MRKLILLTHISLDGFVAGMHGELDNFPRGEENLQFVCDLTKNADAALFGRISYELLNSHWPTVKNNPGATKPEIDYCNWYNNAEKMVVSKTLSNKNLNRTIIVSGNISEEISKIKQKNGLDILLFGSPSVSQLLMQQNLIDDYWIFINPVVFKNGIPLFAKTNKATLKLINTKPFPNGEVALHYST